ncbi:MAG: phytoene desaturase family protein [Deltaproteobacteria bacterium]
MENTYDAIIIGSGIGGLTSAVLLSKIYNEKVLVLEQHFVAGGQTHEFMRVNDGIKYHWDVGVHYLGEMKKGLMSRKVFDFLTESEVDWIKMTDPHDVFYYPGLKFSQNSNPVKFRNELISMFPDEKIAIEKYFKDLKKAASWFRNYLMSGMISFQPLSKLIRMKNESFALATTQSYLDTNFRDKKLKAILTSIWGDYGVPPSKSAFVVHAIVVRSYLYGGYYPEGGASSIANSMIKIIERHGGKILCNKNVEKIIIKSNKAAGVEVATKNGTEHYYSNKIISNAGAYNTFTKLLPGSFKVENNLEFPENELGFSCNTLYIGLKESPEKLGIKGENMWIFDDFDHDKNYTDSINTDEIKSAFISFPSLKNPLAQSHTMEIISFSRFERFKKWENTRWKKRGEDYESLKQSISEKLIEMAEKNIPGISNLISYHELSTPLSMKHFTSWESGSFYSFPATPERFINKAFKAKTPLKNLYLTGTDAGMLGVLGALYGAVFSTIKLKGLPSFMKIMSTISK